MKPPFSLKRLREARERALAARDGWRQRRRTSDSKFPFRLQAIVPPDKWDWTLPIFSLVITVAALIAVLIIALM